MDWEPGYLSLTRSGELRARAAEAWQRLEHCDICPRECGANRLLSARGAGCRTGARALVSSYHPHFGEEAPLVGRGGSGTVFFAWCNLHCQYCQNYEISQLGHGHEVSAEQLASIMLHLQALGCHNINLVSPTHVVPQILAAVSMAAEAGLRLPLVYNSGGYDSVKTLALLDGAVDIYMPDMKYGDAAVGHRLSLVTDYPTVNAAAVLEMHRQVGDLMWDEHRIAYRGLLVRHLVLPNGLAATGQIMSFLAQSVSPGTYVNVMAQYRPCYRASEHPDLNRSVTPREFSEAVQNARSAGLSRLDAHNL